jgi:ABC-type transporter Mla subunit MlaD
MARLRDTIRNFVDVVPSRHRTRPVTVGLIVIALSGLALLSAALRHIPLTPKGGRIMQAEFSAADQVSGRSVVRVGGIEVGQVERIGPGADPDRTSLVKMRITDNSVRLHTDATAQVRWRTVFGGLMYIDLHPGSASAPLLGDRPIPASQTSNQTELDQLLQIYAAPTATRQKQLLHGLTSALTTPAAIDRTLQTLKPALTTVDNGLRPLLGTETGDLRGLVAAASKTVASLSNPTSLENLVTGAERTLAVTDAERSALGSTMELLPPSLRSTVTTMNRLRTTLGHLDPLVSALEPGARILGPTTDAATPTLAEANTVLHDADPLLRAAGPAFDALRGASRSGVPLLGALDPTIQRLGAQLIPFLQSRDSGTKLRIYESIGPFFSSISSAASEYDAIGHRIRLEVPPAITGFLTTPPTSFMNAACDRSTIKRASAICPRLAGALARGWFEAKGARK